MANTKRIYKLKNQAEVIVLFFADLLSVLAAFNLAFFVRTEMLPVLYSGFPEPLPFSFLNKLWIFIVWIFFCYYEGLYTERFSFWDEIKALWKVAFFSSIGIFTIVSIGKLSDEISRTVIVLMGLFSFAVLPVIRINTKRLFRRLGFFKRRVLILGAGETGKIIARALRKEPHFGYEIMGFLDDDPEKLGMRIDGIKIHRGVDSALRYIIRCNVEDLFIAMPGAGKERLQGIINNYQHKVGRILFVPDIFGVAVLGTSLQHFFHEEVLAFEIENNLAKPLNIFVKRCFDVLVSIVLIPVLAIPMAILAILIRLDSKGPAIFTQERIGKRGRTFRCYKFRTMYADAEKRLKEIFRNDSEAMSEWEQHWKLRDDPRVTRVGRFLRSTSLDELPQIFNVLRGDMGLVGPRPYLPEEKHCIGGYDHVILLTKPGITGLWQVSGRSNTRYDYRIALDLWYVRNWNLWLDIVILLKTVRIVIKKEGAY
jgi:undecaprenyl-phosphate galactose phosphotransferase